MYYDISPALNGKLPRYPGDPEFCLTQISDIKDGFRLSSFSMSAHFGAHIDAPAHFIEGGKTISDYPPEAFTGRAKVFSFTNIPLITPEHLKDKSIALGDIILFKTDNSKAGFKLLESYTTISPSAAKLLTPAKLVGIDYINIEPKESLDFSVHKTLLKNNVLILEGINLFNVPDGEYDFFAFPLNISGAEAGPCRAVLKDV